MALINKKEQIERKHVSTAKYHNFRSKTPQKSTVPPSELYGYKPESLKSMGSEWTTQP